MTYNDCMNMSFKELFHAVFTDSGQVKPCGRGACSALIERLNVMYLAAFGISYVSLFGDAEHGFLKLPDAFEIAKQFL